MSTYIKRRSRLDDFNDNRISFTVSLLTSWIHGTLIMSKCILIIYGFVLHCVNSSANLPFFTSLWSSWPNIAMPRPSVPWNDLDSAMRLVDTTDPVPLDLSLVITDTKTQDRIQRALSQSDSKEFNIELEAEEMIFNNKSTEMKMEEPTDDDSRNNDIVLTAEEFTHNPNFSDEDQVENSNKTDGEITELIAIDNYSKEVELVDIIDAKNDNITELIAEEFMVPDTNPKELNILDILHINNDNTTDILPDTSSDLNNTTALEDVTHTTQRDEIIENPDSTTKRSKKKLRAFPKVKLSYKKPKINSPQNITTPPSFIPIFKPREGISKRKHRVRTEEKPILDNDSSKPLETISNQTEISDINIQQNANGNFKQKSSNPNISKPMEGFVELPYLILEQNGKSDPVQSQNGDKNHLLVLFKPETVTLTKFYGEFMRKLSMTVLVPFYVSELKEMA